VAVVEQQTTALVYLEAQEVVLVAATPEEHLPVQVHQGKALLVAMAAIHPIGRAVVEVLVPLVLPEAQPQLMCRVAVLAALELQAVLAAHLSLMLAVVAALAMPQAAVVLLGQVALVAVGTELLAITLAMLAAPLVQQTQAAAVVGVNFQAGEI
jgi:hypothetical protein